MSVEAQHATVTVDGAAYTVHPDELTKFDRWDGVKPVRFTVQRKDTEQGTREVLVSAGCVVEIFAPDSPGPQVPADRKPRTATAL